MAYYDTLAPGYDELHGEEQEAKMRLISPFVKGRVLDVGCGTGISGKFFKDIVGIDPSGEMIRKAPFPAVQGVAEKLPYADKSFDAVICVTALHNTEYPEVAVREMARVSKGRVVITLLRKSPKFDKLQQLVERSFRVERRIDDPHDLLLICKDKQ
ncbi:MAG: class I SAM-dependent methyltransferase [Nanoarchaeota archaeon]